MTKPTKTPRTVLGYIRVSTEEQAEQGISPEAQETQIRAYCEAHGLILADLIFDNGISAKTIRKRPGLVQALKTLRAGDVDGIAVTKLDRLSRSTRDVLDLVARAEREGWQVHSIGEHLDTSSPSGRFVLTILAGLAQMEREQTAERTKAALAELRRQGRRTSGRPPFGFRFEDGREVEVPGELELLQRLLALKADGLGAQRIANAMNEAGTGNPRTGGAWNRGTVQAILKTAERRAA